MHTLPISPQKGFKQTWLEVYKKYYGQAKNLSKKNFTFEMCTLRKHFDDQFISGVDCWNNFVFATAGMNIVVFLLDETDHESSDLCIRKIFLPVTIDQIHIGEVEWN